jgi:hypothetical protein
VLAAIVIDPPPLPPSTGPGAPGTPTASALNR